MMMESSGDVGDDAPQREATTLEAEEERLREKLKKRRRTDETPMDSGENKTSRRSEEGEGTPPVVTVPPSVDTARAVVPGSQQSTKHPDTSSNRSRPSETQANGGDGSGGRNKSRDTQRYSPSGSRGHRSSTRESHMNRDTRNSRGEPNPGGDNRNRYHRPPPSQPPHYHRRGGPPPPRWERGGPPGYYPDDRGGPPPGYRGGPPLRGEYDYSGYGHRSSRSPPLDHRRRGRSSSRSHNSDSGGSVTSESRSRSRSKSNHRSRSRSVGNGSRNDRKDNHRPSASGRRSSGSRSSRSSGRRSRHSRSPSSSSSSSSSSEEEKELDTAEIESPFSKDQRTVFVSQLVMRTQEKDIRRYFRKKVACLVKEVILLRDKRTGNHKGCAYVQFGRIEDVNKAVAVSGQPPDFQRFPILVKPSEAEKNYVIVASSSVVTASMMGASAPSSKPLLSADGKLIEAQKVYIGSLDPSVTDEHIFALFSQFGQLEKVSLQMDPTTKTSRGFAFLSYRHPEEANLAIQTMSNQVLAGRAIKTGWASQTSTIQGVDIVTSDEFPPDAAERARKAIIVLAKMSGTSDAILSNATISATAERALDAALAGAQTVVTKPGSVPTVADARANLAAARSATTVLDAPAAPIKLIGGEENPTNNVLVHNMFDKDQESGDDWPTEIKEEFEDECSKFGKITSITVMSKEPGGKIYASFVTTEAATLCANNLAGRWFDKRQLRVDFMRDDQMPNTVLLV